MNPNLEIYTEYTPNPDSMKFVANQMFLKEDSVDFRSADHAQDSPLALGLFEKSYVAGVFIMNNFVTVTKDPEIEWVDIIPEVKDFLKEYLYDGREVLVTNPKDAGKESDELNDQSLEEKIKSLLETYVKPAVEQDGGAIQFKSFEGGTVTLTLQGACSGCPSSLVTLKAGIEGLLQRMVPEVKEVVAEEI